MDLDRLSEFSAVARCGSIKKAAEELGLSPATLSARIRSFEKSLDLQLFRRESQGLALTQEGTRLSSNAAAILENYGKLVRELQSARSHTYHSLRIAVSGGSGLPVHLGPFLDQLNRTYPSIRLELMDDRRYPIAEGLQSGQVDLYFASVTAGFELPGIIKTVISSSNQYVILPRSHPLASYTAVSIKALDGECFIPYPKTAEQCLRQFQLSNLTASGIRYTLYEGDTAPQFYKLLVPIGKGLILIPNPVMNLPPNTVCVPVSDLPFPAAPCFFYDQYCTNPDVIAFVCDFTAFIREGHEHEH